MNEQGLRQVLVRLLQEMKEDHKYSTMLGNELAALRDALDELSHGQFKPIMEKHVAAMRAKTSAVEAELTATYDDLIRKIQNGELF